MHASRINPVECNIVDIAIFLLLVSHKGHCMFQCRFNIILRQARMNWSSILKVASKEPFILPDLLMSMLRRNSRSLAPTIHDASFPHDGITMQETVLHVFCECTSFKDVVNLSWFASGPSGPMFYSNLAFHETWWLASFMACVRFVSSSFLILVNDVFLHYYWSR